MRTYYICSVDTVGFGSERPAIVTLRFPYEMMPTPIRLAFNAPPLTVPAVPLRLDMLRYGRRA